MPPTKETLEGIVSFCEFGGVMLTMIGAALLVVSVVANRPLKKIIAEEMATERKAAEEARTIQSMKLAALQKEAADARTRQAEAEKQTAEAIRKSRPRILDHKAFLDELKGKPAVRVEIIYKPDDDEVSILTGQIQRWLGAGDKGDSAGWKIVAIRPLAESDAIDAGYPPWTPLATRAGADSGLGIRVNRKPSVGEDLFKSTAFALTAAFQRAGIAAGPITYDPRMPDDLIKIGSSGF